MKSPHIFSIQVGVPRQYGTPGADDPQERPWTTGFYKEPVATAVYASRLHLEGDGQADMENHGGPDKAICAYSYDHYSDWRQRWGLDLLPTGAFGENFTIAGLTEADVCIGDLWQAGERVVVQVSQPRQPCWKLARRWRKPTLVKEVQQSGRTGWYFRVATQGRVAAGAELTLLQRPAPDWSIERANHVMYSDSPSCDDVRALSELEPLSDSWRGYFARRLAAGA